MAHYENRIVKNRKSPANEAELINAYKDMVPKSKRPDHYDIAAVTAKDGTKGHVMLNESINRSKDREYHRGQNFVPDSELKKHINK